MSYATSPSEHQFRDGKHYLRLHEIQGVPKFSPELCGESWVSIMDHIIRQTKLSDNTLEKKLCNLFGTQLPCP